MNLLKSDMNVVGAEDSTDVFGSQEALLSKLEYYQSQLKKTSLSDLDRAQILSNISGVYLRMESSAECWKHAKEAFDIFIVSEQWEQAVEACDLLFLSDHEDALIALGHGIWMAVTYPIHPQLSVNMLEHLLDESPKGADTRAVAAAAAHFIANLRDSQESDLNFYTGQLLGRIADEHSQISDQRAFDLWMKTMGLDNPDHFLPKLSGVVDQLVEGRWWFDKEVLKAKLPC